MKRKLLFSLLLLAGMTLSAGAVSVKKINIEYNNGATPLSIYRSKVKKIAFSEEEKLTFSVKGVSFDMIKVEAGIFTMGATEEMTYSQEDEKPTHQVTLTKDYYMGKTEVTQALWEAVMGSNPSHFQGDNRPVEEVSWDDITGADGFLAKLNEATGKTFRLPTEAEWEFAARGGIKSKGYQYSGSNTLYEVAWFGINDNRITHDVATKQANELGIYDMSGNVWEWCTDWYGDYSSEPQTDPTGPETGDYRVFRGGCWFEWWEKCHSSARCGGRPSHGDFYAGLRLVLTAE